MPITCTKGTQTQPWAQCTEDSTPAYTIRVINPGIPKASHEGPILELWHGTTVKAAFWILREGFWVNPGPCDLLGTGIYFAEWFRASLFTRPTPFLDGSYRAMVKCRVAVGKYLAIRGYEYRYYKGDLSQFDSMVSQIDIPVAKHGEWCVKSPEQAVVLEVRLFNEQGEKTDGQHS